MNVVPWHMQDPDFFSGLPDEKEKFLCLAERWDYKKGDMIFFEEDPGDACFYIENGLIKIFKISLSGKEPIFFLRKRGEMFGLAEIVESQYRKANAQAITKCTVYKLEKSDWESFLEANYTVARRVIQVLGRRLRYLGEQVETLMACDVRTRLVKLLVYLCYENLSDERAWVLPVKIPVKLTQDQMASMTGSCQQTISELLGNLQKEGDISVSGREITVINPMALFEKIEY